MKFENNFLLLVLIGLYSNFQFIFAVPNDSIGIDLFFVGGKKSINNLIYNKIENSSLSSNELEVAINQIKNNISKQNLKFAQFLFWSDSDLVYLTLEEFKNIVQNTMANVEGGLPLSNISDIKKTNDVITNIYLVAKKLKATQNQLLVFTAISLHNNNLFFTFPKCNKNENKKDTDSSNLSRGLLQLTYHSYYHQIKLISSSKSDYVNKPYLLNMFDENSIEDEFLLFQNVFYEKYNFGSTMPYNYYLKTIKNLQPQEIGILSFDFINKIINNEDFDKFLYIDHLSKIKRRYKIFKSLLDACIVLKMK